MNESLDNVLKAVKDNRKVFVYDGVNLVSSGYIVKVDIDHPSVYITVSDSNITWNVECFSFILG